MNTPWDARCPLLVKRGHQQDYYIFTGQIIATSHDLTLNGGLVREIPLFQGNLGWWNIIPFGQIFRFGDIPTKKPFICHDCILGRVWRAHPIFGPQVSLWPGVGCNGHLGYLGPKSNILEPMELWLLLTFGMWKTDSLRLYEFFVGVKAFVEMIVLVNLVVLSTSCDRCVTGSWNAPVISCPR